jgi:hypothetical protein
MADRFGERPPCEFWWLERFRAIASALEMTNTGGLAGVELHIRQLGWTPAGLWPHKAGPADFADPTDNEMVLFKAAEKGDEKKALELKKWLQQISEPCVQCCGGRVSCFGRFTRAKLQIKCVKGSPPDKQGSASTRVPVRVRNASGSSAVRRRMVAKSTAHITIEELTTFYYAS